MHVADLDALGLMALYMDKCIHTQSSEDPSNSKASPGDTAIRQEISHDLGTVPQNRSDSVSEVNFQGTISETFDFVHTCTNISRKISWVEIFRRFCTLEKGIVSTFQNSTLWNLPMKLDFRMVVHKE